MILVTGATGFVGPKIVAALRARGLPVRVLVRSPAKGAGLDAEPVEGDVTDAESLRRAVEGCDTVVHLVAIINGKRSDYERVMEQGTRDLVAAAEGAGVRRFVLMSALGTTEQSKDLVPYYHAKWEMETAVKASSLEWTIFRPSFVFGRDGGVLRQFLRIARLAPVTPIVGPGTQRIQPIWVEDVAAHYAAAVDAPDAVGRTFEIGGPDVVAWNEFWERVKSILGKRRPSLHVPIPLMRLPATVFELLPSPPVTRDQLTMLEGGDNVVTNDDAARTFSLPLVPLDEQVRRGAATT